MADDPRAATAARAMATEGEEDGCFERVAEWEAMEPWEQASEGEPHDDREDCARWLRKAAAGLAAADAADPLRALLADEDRALKWLDEVSWGGAFPEQPWATVDDWHRNYWGRVKDAQNRAVLAALREVADHA